MRTLRALVAIAIVSVLSGCGYNTIVTQEQNVNAAWSEVLNQYQRRADLIPNIVETVKGEANFEQSTLQNVIEARARATSIQATPELINDPQAFAQFTQAQSQLSSALSRLLVTVENLSEPEGQRSVPGSADAARRHRKSHRNRPQALYRRRGAIQHDDCFAAELSRQDTDRRVSEAAVRGGRRGRGQAAAKGRFRNAEEVATANVVECAPHRRDRWPLVRSFRAVRSWPARRRRSCRRLR